MPVLARAGGLPLLLTLLPPLGQTARWVRAAQDGRGRGDCSHQASERFCPFLPIEAEKQNLKKTGVWEAGKDSYGGLLHLRPLVFTQAHAALHYLETFVSLGFREAGSVAPRNPSMCPWLGWCRVHARSLEAWPPPGLLSEASRGAVMVAISLPAGMGLPCVLTGQERNPAGKLCTLIPHEGCR